MPHFVLISAAHSSQSPMSLYSILSFSMCNDSSVNCERFAVSVTGLIISLVYPKQYVQMCDSFTSLKHISNVYSPCSANLFPLCRRKMYTFVKMIERQQRATNWDNSSQAHKIMIYCTPQDKKMNDRKCERCMQ